MKGKIGTNYPKGYWDQFKDEMIKLYKNGAMTTYQLADKYSTTPQTILRYLKRWGVYDRSTAFNKKNKFVDCGDFYIGYTRAENYEFYIDKKHYDLIWQYCWHKHQDGYLRTCIGQKENGGNIYKLMHVMIMEAEGYDWTDEEEIDHINGKPNDNRVENLRIVTHSNNMKNEKLYANNTSGYKGVYYSKKEQKWKAHITSDNVVYHLGTFNTKTEAIEARKAAEDKLHREYVRNEKDLHNGTRGMEVVQCKIIIAIVHTPIL